MIQIVKLHGGGMIYPSTRPHPRIPSVFSLFQNYQRVVDFYSQAGEEPVNFYYTAAHHAGACDGSDPSRKAGTFQYQEIIVFDFDWVDVSKPFQYAEILAKRIEVPVSGMTIVCSGNGFQFVIGLKTLIQNAKYLSENKPYYNEICSQLTADIKAAELPLDKVDPVVFEPARVFRLPGSINLKEGKRTQATLIQYSEDRYDLDLYRLSGWEQLHKENLTEQEVRRQFPTPDFKEIVKECGYIQYIINKKEGHYEPEVFDFLGLLAPMPESSTVLVDGQEFTPSKLAEHVCVRAVDSTSVQKTGFEVKWSNARKYGCRKCDTIAIRWDGCARCPHRGKVITPLALKSKEHIGSESCGYWVTGQKGQQLHPHYEDLSKVYFTSTNSFTAPESERMFVWNGEHYREQPILLIKNWLEKTVNPSHPLREVHRNEFIYKIKSVSALVSKTEKQMFHDSIRGKINFKNGVLDVMTGDMSPHDPQCGFLSVLPYNYIPEQTSPFFLDWLSEVCEDNVEYMETLLDLMAYTLWPGYEDALMAFFTGSGANGKSTLTGIICSMVGKDSYSSVSVHQLTQNRFSPAELEGKMVNVSNEASGDELNSQALNVLKILSEGGELLVERKNKKPFIMHNQAKLFFAVNKVPRFAESDHAIKRRLIVIPFNHRIETPDANVGKRLVEEVPKIISMLIPRIQQNVKANAGKFVVNRGGRLLADAQETFLIGGHPVYEWSKERIVTGVEVPLEKHITVEEAYADYRQWCEQSGVKSISNKIQFGRMMTGSIICKAHSDGDRVKRVGKEIKRVYPRTKWRNEV